MSHSAQAQRAAQKRQPVEYVDIDEYADSLLSQLNGWEAVKDKADNNQGASDGRKTED